MTQTEIAESQTEDTAAQKDEMAIVGGDSESENSDLATEASEVDAAADVQKPNEEETPSETLILSDNGEIVWNNVAIARLLPNQALLYPKFELIGDELNKEETAKIVSQRLDGWLVETIRTDLAPLFRLKRAIEYTAPIVPVVEVISKSSDEKIAEETPAPDAAQTETIEAEAPQTDAQTDEQIVEAQALEAEALETEAPVANPKIAKKPIKPVRAPMQELTPAAKEVAQIVFENCGILDRSLYEAKIAALSQDNRRELRSAGIKFGRNAIYLPMLLKPKPARLNVILSKLSKGELNQDALLLPPLGVTSFEAKEGFEGKDYLLCGFQKLGNRAIRLDIVDRVIDTLFDAAKEAKGGFEMPIAVVSLLGVSNEAAQNILIALGWSADEGEDGVKKWRFKRPTSNYKRPENTRKPRTDGARNDGAKKGENRFKDQRGARPQGLRPEGQGFKKKHKDKGEKMRTPRDYNARPSRNIEDSPFAILASLKADLQNKKD